MQDHRRLLLLAILVWSVSASGVHAQSNGSSEPCNAFCRLWLGRGDRQQQAPPPVVAGEAPQAVETAPQDQDAETLPIVRMKRNVATRARRPASPPLAPQPSDVPVEDRAAPGDPSKMAQPMDLTPDEADEAPEAVPAVRLAPLPPRRPMLQGRQARSRPAVASKAEAAMARPLPKPKPGVRQIASPAVASPAADRSAKAAAPSPSAASAMAPATPLSHPSTVAVTASIPAPSRRPDSPVSRVPAVLPGPPASAAPLAVMTPAPTSLSAQDTGSTSVGRTVPAVESTHLHDVAPGPRPALTADSAAAVAHLAKRPGSTSPDETLESLKETILRSAQDALKQSGVQGF